MELLKIRILKMFVSLAITAFGAVYVYSNSNNCGFSQSIVKAMESFDEGCSPIVGADLHKEFEADLHEKFKVASKDVEKLNDKSSLDFSKLLIGIGVEEIKEPREFVNWKGFLCGIVCGMARELLYSLPNYEEEYKTNIKIMISDLKNMSEEKGEYYARVVDVGAFLGKILELLKKLEYFREELELIRGLVYLVNSDDSFRNDFTSRFFDDVCVIFEYLEYKLSIIRDIKECVSSFFENSCMKNKDYVKPEAHKNSKEYNQRFEESKEAELMCKSTFSLLNVKDESDLYKLFKIDYDILKLGDFDKAYKGDGRFNEKILNLLFKWLSRITRK